MTTASVFVANVQYTRNSDGAVFNFTVTKPVGDTLNASTINAGALPAAGPSATQRRQTIVTLQNAFNAATPSVLGSDGLGLNGGGIGGQNSSGIAFTPGGGLSAGATSTGPGSEFARRYGLSTHAQQGRSNTGFRFSLNPRQVAAAARRRAADKASKLGYGGVGDETAPSPWVFSASGRYVDFKDNQTNADRSGHLWYVTTALGYRFTNTTTAGVFTRYREGKVKSSALNASLDGKYYGGGLYIATTIAGGVRLIGAGLYEFGDNDSTIAGTRGKFNSDIITLEGSIDKRFKLAALWIEPALALLYNNADNEKFTDSAGTAVPGSTQELGRVTFGPTFGTTFGGDGDVEIRPFARIRGIWDFVHEDDVVTATGVVLKTGVTAITLGAGMELEFFNRLAVRIAGDWFNYNTKLEAWSISGGIGGSFTAFGLADVAPTGSASLDFAGTAYGATATMRITIPFGAVK